MRLSPTVRQSSASFAAAAVFLLLTACGGGSPESTLAASTMGPLPTLQDATFKPAGNPITQENGARAILLGVLNGHTATVNRFDWSPDHKLLLTIDGAGEVFKWDMNTGIKQFELRTPDGLSAAYFSADSNVIIGVGNDQQVYFFSATDGAPLSSLPTNIAAITASAFAPDRRLLAIGGRNGSVQLWNTDSRSLVFNLQSIAVPLPTPTLDLAQPMQTRTTAKISLNVNALAFSADQSVIAAGLTDGTVRTWNVKTGQPMSSITDIGAPVAQIAFPATGTTFVAAAGSTVYIYDQPGFTRRYSMIEDQSAVGRGLGLSPDGRYAGGVGSGDIAYVWELGSPTVTTIALPDQRGLTTQISFAPSGAFVVTSRSGAKGGAILWDVNSFATAREGVLGRPINEFGNGVFAVSWSPDNRWLALADASGGVTLWGLPAG